MEVKLSLWTLTKVITIVYIGDWDPGEGQLLQFLNLIFLYFKCFKTYIKNIFNT